jgi:hypothetical protein
VYACITYSVLVPPNSLESELGMITVEPLETLQTNLRRALILDRRQTAPIAIASNPKDQPQMHSLQRYSLSPDLGLRWPRLHE